MTKITIPVNAGFLYRVGEVKVEGNKVFAGPISSSTSG